MIFLAEVYIELYYRYTACPLYSAGTHRFCGGFVAHHRWMGGWIGGSIDTVGRQVGGVGITHTCTRVLVLEYSKNLVLGALSSYIRTTAQYTQNGNSRVLFSLPSTHSCTCTRRMEGVREWVGVYLLLRGICAD